MIEADALDPRTARDEPSPPPGEESGVSSPSPAGAQGPGEGSPTESSRTERLLEETRRELEAERDRNATLEAQLARLERLVGSCIVVSDVAHTLNNMLTGALGFTHLLGRSELAEGPRERRMLNTVSTELTRCAGMTRNLLSYSRNLPRPPSEPVDLGALVKQVVEHQRDAFAQQGIDLLVDISHEPAVIVGVHEQILQVLRELLENARRAIVSKNRGGWIKIRLACDESGWRLDVSDSGGGVREPERAFEPFYTSQELSPGAGLGLATAKGVMREHGGRIYLTRGEEGAIFTLSFPRPQTAADLTHAPDSASARTR